MKLTQIPSNNAFLGNMTLRLKTTSGKFILYPLYRHLSLLLCLNYQTCQHLGTEKYLGNFLLSELFSYLEPLSKPNDVSDYVCLKAWGKHIPF